MDVEMVTCVMICNDKTNEVLVQNRKRKFFGWSFPGGHVERGESLHDCAVREVMEETGLTVYNLKYCGVVHWMNRESDRRYLCFMYKTSDFSGELIAETDEGEQFWMGMDEFYKTPIEKFTSAKHYSFSPLFREYGKYSEAFVSWGGGDITDETTVCF